MWGAGSLFAGRREGLRDACWNSHPPMRMPPFPLFRFVFHGVHMMLQFGSSAEGLGKPWQPGAKRFNRVVFIGAPRGKAQPVGGTRAAVWQAPCES